jgi:hypothetical protein
MAEQTRPPQPSGQGKQPNAGGQSSGGFLGGKLPSWSMFVLLAVVIGSVLWFSSAEPKSNELRYDQLVTQIKQDKIESVTWDNTTGKIEGTFAGTGDKTFTSTGPAEAPQGLEALLKENNVEYTFETPQQSGLLSLLSIILPFALILGFFAWICRSAARRPRPTAPSGPAPPSPTSPATRASSRRSPRSSTSCDARAVPRDRRPRAQGHAARRASRHRQDAVRPRRGR